MLSRAVTAAAVSAGASFFLAPTGVAAPDADAGDLELLTAFPGNGGVLEINVDRGLSAAVAAEGDLVSFESVLVRVFPAPRSFRLMFGILEVVLGGSGGGSSRLLPGLSLVA